MTITEAKKKADEIIELFLSKGGEYYAGEEITQLEHACQTVQFAGADGKDDEVILAAFLHDIGHLISEDTMDGFGVKDHETAGANYLQQCGFSDMVITLVKSHVDAKRYLCFANKWYFDNLSEASKETLVYQGGAMLEKEAKEFEKNPLKNLIIKMRTWDEKAKEKNVPLPDLEFFRNKITAHLMKK